MSRQCQVPPVCRTASMWSNFLRRAGGEIASTFDHPEVTKLGRCKLIEEIMIGEDKLIHFSGVQMGEACTIVLRGASATLCQPV